MPDYQQLLDHFQFLLGQTNVELIRGGTIFGGSAFIVFAVLCSIRGASQTGRLLSRYALVVGVILLANWTKWLWW
jgi:hypothetical protein